MKTGSIKLLKELAHDYWQLNLELDNDFITSLENVLLHTQVNGITQGRVIQYPEFLVSCKKTFILNSGLAISPEKIESVYLHKGMFRELAISFSFVNSQTELKFEFNLIDTQDLSLLLSSVIATYNKLPTKPKLSSDLTCPCCLEKQAEIRLTPQLHPLFTVLETMTNSALKISLRITTNELDIYEFYELQYSKDLCYIDAIVSIHHHKNGVINIDLAKIHSITMAAKRHQQEDCIQFCLFDSFANNVCEIIIHDTSYFTQWKNYLFPNR